MGDGDRLPHTLPGGEEAARSAGDNLCEVAAVYGTDGQAAHAVVGRACCSDNRLGPKILLWIASISATKSPPTIPLPDGKLP